MRYTSKLRLLILLIAVLPPFVIISILKFSTEQKIEIEQHSKITQSYKKAEAFVLSEQGRLKYNVQELIKDSLFVKLFSAKKKPTGIPKVFLQRYNLSFLYILNSSGELLFSANQQNNPINIFDDIQELKNRNILTKVTDFQGNHAAFTFVTEIDSSHYVYAGKYFDQTMQYLLANIADASVAIQFNETIQFDKLGDIHKTEDGYKAVLLYSPNDKIVITLDFQIDNSRQLFIEVLQIISIVTVCMIVLVILVGLYLTGRTRREIDNLRSAFASVAKGNFSTTVMAYEKSEFSELADSFSEMVTQLKKTQTKLGTVEKIAAWETVGRKLAHEIKNPLSPISIAADDLRSSYYEKLPNFDNILNETTSTIKKEVKRMTLLLDEFVSFARMKQSDLQDVNFSEFVKGLQKLYTNEIASQRLQIKSDVSATKVKLDRDTFTQLFINLIKNGFESSDAAIVEVTIQQIDSTLKIVISDNGSGFSEAKLENSFRPFDTTKKNGSGLGLVICHRIILDHKGTMTLQNNKNGGGEVVVTLPIA